MPMSGIARVPVTNKQRYETVAETAIKQFLHRSPPLDIHSKTGQAFIRDLVRSTLDIFMSETKISQTGPRYITNFWLSMKNDTRLSLALRREIAQCIQTYCTENPKLATHSTIEKYLPKLDEWLRNHPLPTPKPAAILTASAPTANKPSMHPWQWHIRPHIPKRQDPPYPAVKSHKKPMTQSCSLAHTVASP